MVVVFYNFKYPLWVITCVGKDGFGKVGYFIISGSDTEECLTKAIKIIIKDLKKHLNLSSSVVKAWKKKVWAMIDQDQVEMNSLDNNDFRFRLCKFHLRKNIIWRINTHTEYESSDLEPLLAPDKPDTHQQTCNGDKPTASQQGDQVEKL